MNVKLKVYHLSKIPFVRKFEKLEVHFIFNILTLMFVILWFLTQPRLTILQFVSFDITNALLSSLFKNESPMILSPGF